LWRQTRASPSLLPPIVNADWWPWLVLSISKRGFLLLNQGIERPTETPRSGSEVDADRQPIDDSGYSFFASKHDASRRLRSHKSFLRGHALIELKWPTAGPDAGKSSSTGRLKCVREV
jgi:hypothetical protein